MQNISRRKTLFTYTLPAIMSNACIFLFTIVDGVFVGRGVGTDALGAVNIVMPVVMSAMALFMLTAVGGVTIAAVRLGRGDNEGANQVFLHSLAVTLFVTAALTIVGTFFTEPVSRLLGANDNYLEMVKEYLFWYSVFIIPSGFSTVLQSFCRNDGSPGLVGMATVIGTACNIFGDWLFVFPLQMGVKGAAIATGLSQVVTLIVVLTHFVRKKGVLRFQRFKPSGELYRKILFRGLPGSVAQFSTPVTTICMNNVLLSNIGDIGVNSFSIVSYIASFAMAIMFGTSEGLQPLFGQTYGAKNEKDLKYYYRSGMIMTLIGGCAVFLLTLLFGRAICILFGADAVTLEYTVKYMPQYAWGFIVAGLNTLISSYLYSTMRSSASLAMNIMRSFVFNTIIVLGLPAIFGGNIVWFTFGIYECLVFILAIVLKKYTERKGLVFDQ